MLIEQTLWGTIDKVQVAIDRIKTFEPPEGYYVAFQGEGFGCHPRSCEAIRGEV